MNFNEFQEQSRQTALYPKLGISIEYPLMGLMGEFGELSEKFKKVLRDNEGKLTEDRKEGIIGELGDLCWYLFQIYSELKISFNDNYENNDLLPSLTENVPKLLVAMHTCVSDIAIFCVGNNHCLLSRVTEPSNHLVYFIKHIAKMCDTDIETIMQKNINKLQDRLKRNMIKGDGDTR